MEDFAYMNSELIIVRKDDNKELMKLIDDLDLKIINTEKDERA